MEGLSKAVTISIDQTGWLVGVPGIVPGTVRSVYKGVNWGIGPIEVARILRRLGLTVNVEVEK